MDLRLFPFLLFLLVETSRLIHTLHFFCPLSLPSAKVQLGELVSSWDRSSVPNYIPSPILLILHQGANFRPMDLRSLNKVRHLNEMGFDKLGSVPLGPITRLLDLPQLESGNTEFKWLNQKNGQNPGPSIWSEAIFT